MSNYSAMKIRGWTQHPKQISATRKHEVGEVRKTADGREFVYAKNGAGALAAGKLAIAKTINSNWMDQTCSAVALKAKQMTLTITTGAAVNENEFANGFLQINDGVAEGDSYKIESNTSMASGGTSITLTLAEAIRGTALTTGGDFSLIHNPAYEVTHTAGQAVLPVGYPLVDVTAAYYCWLQTNGIAACLIEGTPAVGAKLTPSADVAGAIGQFATPEDPVVGNVFGTAGASGEYKPVRLTIGH